MSLPPVRCDLSFLPSHVVSVLEKWPSPGYVYLLRSLSRWACLVKRHGLRSVQNGTAKMSPPVWHGDALLVLHTEPREGSYSESSWTTKTRESRHQSVSICHAGNCFLLAPGFDGATCK